jgi:hypothetical protein
MAVTDVDWTEPGVQFGSGSSSPCSNRRRHGELGGGFVVDGNGAKVGGLGLAVNGVVLVTVAWPGAGELADDCTGPQATTTASGARKRPACFSFMMNANSTRAFVVPLLRY